MSIGYTATISLKHNEKAAKVNAETGEIKIIENRPNNIPDGKEVFEPNGIFQKQYIVSWKFLNQYLTDKEYRVASELGLMAKANTNSLEPLNDETIVNQLIDNLGGSINNINPILKKLFNLGVYGKFDVSKADERRKKYWVFNPYLSFSGKLIKSDISELFDGTHIELAYKANQRNKVYALSDEVISELKLKKPKIKG
jgi:hypothetical protein